MGRAETIRFPEPEIKTYHRGQLEELIGPGTTQYAPPLWYLSNARNCCPLPI